MHIQQTNKGNHVYNKIERADIFAPQHSTEIIGSHIKKKCLRKTEQKGNNAKHSEFLFVSVFNMSVFFLFHLILLFKGAFLLSKKVREMEVFLNFQIARPTLEEATITKMSILTDSISVNPQGPGLA